MRAADIMLQKFGAPVLIDCIYEPQLDPNDGAHASPLVHQWGGS